MRPSRPPRRGRRTGRRRDGNDSLAEDDPLVRAALVRTLREAGYKVLAAANGEEAVEIFVDNSGQIALVLLDMMMPRMGGREAHARIRRDQPGRAGRLLHRLRLGFGEARRGRSSRPVHSAEARRSGRFAGHDPRDLDRRSCMPGGATAPTENASAAADPGRRRRACICGKSFAAG